MLFTNTPCVLENCGEISIGPYNLGYPMLDKHFHSSALDISKVVEYCRLQSMDESRGLK